MSDMFVETANDNLVDTDVYVLTVDNSTDPQAPAPKDTDMMVDILGFTPKVLQRLREKLPNGVEVSVMGISEVTSVGNSMGREGVWKVY